jgi:hypothetical protein
LSSGGAVTGIPHYSTIAAARSKCI